MASTRSTTGNSKPRIQMSISTAPERKRNTTTTTTKGRTTKTTGTGAGVKKRPAAHHQRKPHLSDKVKGAAEKAVGTVTHKPGKKAAGTKKMRGTDGKNARGRSRKA
ncbi:hypothetical protein F5Y15DRAFT_397405 [Xylariaceae sp. FL0016]|nr:hypothetical protein F5Y15DRAFT_397405 [Xylariaceae sp. FL0016]